MATTLQIIDAVVERLKVKIPQLAVEYFPDRPAEYRLNHPKGALLVSYLGAKYDEPIDTSAIVQPAVVKFAITATLRQLNSHLQGHPCAKKTCGVELSTGPLGLGPQHRRAEFRGQGRFRGNPSRHVPRPGILLGEPEPEKGTAAHTAHRASCKASRMVAYPSTALAAAPASAWRRALNSRASCANTFSHWGSVHSCSSRASASRGRRIGVSKTVYCMQPRGISQWSSRQPAHGPDGSNPI